MPVPALKMNSLLRWLALALALSLLGWLPFEDTSLQLIFAFSWAIVLLAAWGVLKRQFPRNVPWWAWLAAGLLAGAAVTPLALLLMAVKTGLHGHGAPDFTGAQIQLASRLVALWLAAGGFLGLGAALLYRAAGEDGA